MRASFPLRGGLILFPMCASAKIHVALKPMRARRREKYPMNLKNLIFGSYEADEAIAQYLEHHFKSNPCGLKHTFTRIHRDTNTLFINHRNLYRSPPATHHPNHHLDRKRILTRREMK